MGENKVGRPPKFKTVPEMQSAIDEYFDYCDNRVIKVYSKSLEDVVEINKPEPYTIEGLCLALDMSRRALLDYEKKDKFLHTIKKAKLKVQRSIVLHSLESNPAGAIFNLKNNFGYKDKTETDVNVSVPKKIQIEYI